MIERKQGSGTRVSTSKWGMLHSGTTNWKSYVEGDTFLPVLPLIKRIKQEANSIKDIYDLASGDLPTDLFPSSLLESFLKDSTEVETGFEHVQGQLLLRETIAHYMKKFYNINATSSSIIVTTGIQQSIYLITQCLLSPGDAIAIESPSYIYPFLLFQSAGLRVFGLPVDENGINPEDIITLYRKHRIKFIFLNPTYQNPTRTVLSENRWKRIAEIAAELNIPISEGDSYNPYLL